MNSDSAATQLGVDMDGRDEWEYIDAEGGIENAKTPPKSLKRNRTSKIKYTPTSSTPKKKRSKQQVCRMPI